MLWALQVQLSGQKIHRRHWQVLLYLAAHHQQRQVKHLLEPSQSQYLQSHLKRRLPNISIFLPDKTTQGSDRWRLFQSWYRATTDKQSMVKSLARDGHFLDWRCDSYVRFVCQLDELEAWRGEGKLHWKPVADDKARDIDASQDLPNYH